MATSYELIGVIFEILFLALGVYLYLFARGFFTPSDPAKAEKVNEFRKDNKNWIRLLGLALAAVFLFNVVLSLKNIFFS